MRDAGERLRDTLEAIAHIERSAAALHSRRMSWSRTGSSGTCRSSGEAERSLPTQVKDRAPGIAWNEIVEMRHVLVHDYFGIDVDVVWGVVERELPELKRKVEELLRLVE